MPESSYPGETAVDSTEALADPASPFRQDAASEKPPLRVAVLAPGTERFQEICRTLTQKGLSVVPVTMDPSTASLTIPAGLDALIACLADLDRRAESLVPKLAASGIPPLIVAVEQLSAASELAFLRLGAQEVVGLHVAASDADACCERLRQAVLCAIQRHRFRLQPEPPPQERQTEIRAIMDLFPVGVMMTDWDGRLRLANSRAQKILAERDSLFIDPTGLVRLFDRNSTTLLRQTMRQVRDGADSSCALNAPRRSGLAALSILVVPVGHQPSGAALFLAAPEAPLSIAPATLGGLYGLTLAEARIVIALVAGQKLDEAAQASGTSPHTVRNHLKAIFRKTGTNRQAELVKLVLTGPAVFRHAPIPAGFKTTESGRSW